MGKKLRLVLALVLVACMTTVFAACGSKLITGIAMDEDTMPNTTIGIDESFSIEGAKIVVTYDNGNTTKWDVTDTMVTYSPAPEAGNKWSQPGDVEVTVTFSRHGQEFTTNFTLHIVASGEVAALDNAIAELAAKELTWADKATADALMAQYQALDQTEQGYIQNYDKLVDAIAKITADGDRVASVVLTAPSVTDYKVGDIMNWAGASATVTKVNGTSSVVALTAENASISGFDTTTAGEKTVTITYEGEKVEFKINVVDTADAEKQAAIDAYNALVKALPAADALQYTQVAQVGKAREAYDALVEKYGKIEGVTDEAVKALETKIEENNKAVQAIIDTFIAADKVTYADKATIVKSRTDFDNIANGWTGYVTEEQKAVLTASEAVIVEMEKAIEQFRTLAAKLPSVADYVPAEDAEFLMEVEEAFYELILNTLKYAEPEDFNYTGLADAAGIRDEWDKIQALYLYPSVQEWIASLQKSLDSIGTDKPSKVTKYIYQQAVAAVESYEAGLYPDDPSVVEAMEQLKAVVEQIEAGVKELTDKIDALFASVMTLANEEQEPELSPYETKKQQIIDLRAELNASIYSGIIDSKYSDRLWDAKYACDAADALIAMVQTAIDGAVIENSLTEVAEIEALYNELAEMEVFGDAPTYDEYNTYRSDLKKTTAEAFFGVNLTTEVDRTTLDEKEVAFVQGILDSISDPIKYDQVGLIEKARTEFDMLSEANQAKVTGMDKLEAAEAQIENYKELAADATAKIDAIPNPVKVDEAGKAQIEAAREAYEKLGNDGWKELVSAERLEKLMKAEKDFWDLRAAVKDFFENNTLPADADLKPGDYVATTEGEVTTYSGILGDILTGYNNLVKGHDEIAANASVAEFKAQLDALIDVVVAEDAKVAAFNKAVDEFVITYDASTAALREQLAAIRANWKTAELIPGYVAAVEDNEATEDVNEAKPETTTKLDEFDAAIKAENDRIAAFLAVALPTVDELTYEQYITAVGEYANIFEQAEALYALLAEYTTKNHEEVIAHYELLTALFIDIPAQGVEGEEGYVPAKDSEITRLNKSVDAVEAMIDALSDTFNYAEKDAITEAYNAYHALEKGWIAAVDEAKADKIEKLYAGIATAEAAVADLKADIEALPTADEMVYDDVKDIEAARAAYNEIVLADNGIDASSIKTLLGAELCDKLAALEERVTKLTKTVQEIQAQINAIDPTTYASNEAVKAARAAYDAFVIDGQGFHVQINIANLEAAEKYIADCDEACAEFLAYVEENLPAKAEDLTLTQAGKIAGAEELYNKLDADIQNNNEKVIAAKALIDACKEQDELNKQTVADFVAGVEGLGVTKIEDDPETEDVVESGWNTDSIDITDEQTVAELNETLEALKTNGYDKLPVPETDPVEYYITQDILDMLAAATDKINSITSKIQAILDKIEAIEKLDESNTVVNYDKSEEIMAIIVEEFDALSADEKATTIGQKIEAYRTSINEMTAKAEAYIAADKLVVVDKLDYTDASRESVTDLRAAYDALVDGWNKYVNAETEAAVSDANLLAAEAKIDEFEKQLADAEALVEAILAKNFVTEATAARATETVIAYSDRAEIMAAKAAYEALGNVAGLKEAFDEALKAELDRVVGIVDTLDQAVGTEIADKIMEAFTPLYTKVTLESGPVIEGFKTQIAEFRNGWGEYLAVGYPEAAELLKKAEERFNALVAGKQTFIDKVHEALDGKNAEDVTYDMKSILDEIREYYKETFVTESDREEIRALPEYETLEAFESAWQLKYVEAMEVYDMIEAITYPLDAATVSAANDAYEAIKAQGYGFENAITNYDKLVGYMDELSEKYETPEAIQSFLDGINVDDWKSFATVDYGTVNNFLTKVYVNFGNLPEEEKDKISEEAQAKVEPLKEAGDALMAALDEIQKAIDAIDPAAVDLSAEQPEDGSVYLANEALKAVEAAEGDNDTNKANKATWKNQLNLEKLNEAEAKIQAIKDAMEKFIEDVNNLPAKDKIDFENAQDVFNAESDYNNLSEEAKQDPEVQEAYEKLQDLLEEANKYGKFSEAYAEAVKAFAAAYYNKAAGTTITDLSAFYMETVTLPADVEGLKIGAEALSDEKIRVSVGNNNFIEAPAFTIDENGKLLLALPMIGTSLSNGKLEISYVTAGETVTKTLTAYDIKGTLRMGDVKAVYTKEGYDSTVTLNGSMVTFKSEHGGVAVGIELSNNGASITDVEYMFTKKTDLTSGAIPTYGFTAFEEGGYVVYPKYTGEAITADTASEAQSREYQISLDGYGTIKILLSFEYTVKA